MSCFSDATFLVSITFLWKVVVITLVSCLPLYIAKFLRHKYAPSSYSKLTWPNGFHSFKLNQKASLLSLVTQIQARISTESILLLSNILALYSLKITCSQKKLCLCELLRIDLNKINVEYSWILSREEQEQLINILYKANLFPKLFYETYADIWKTKKNGLKEIFKLWIRCRNIGCFE